MWMQIAWRSDLPLVECEKRLGRMPRRSFLVIRSGPPVVVARPATEIRGRLFPSPVAQAAVALCVFVLVLLGLAVIKGIVASSLSALLFGLLAICAALAALGWRTGRHGSDLITTSIENTFHAERTG